jgi:hypothetical protein
MTERIHDKNIEETDFLGIENKFQPQFEIVDNETFKSRLGLWHAGELSSRSFLPLVLGQLLSVEGLQIEGQPINTTAAKKEVWEKIITDPFVEGRFTSGYLGENPPIDDRLSSYYSYLKDFYPRVRPRGRRLADLEIYELGLLIKDLPQLISSLPAQIMVYQWMESFYKTHQELMVIEKYRRAFEETDPQRATLWMKWLLSEYLLSSVRYFAVETALLGNDSVVDVAKMGSFSNLDSFLRRSKIPIVFYFLGWERRLAEARKILKDQLLRDFEDNEKAYIIMESVIFLSMPGQRSEAIARVLKEVINNNYSGAEAVLFEICAEHWAKTKESPLSSWAMKKLGIDSQQVEERGKTIKKEKVTAGPRAAGRKAREERLKRLKKEAEALGQLPPLVEEILRRQGIDVEELTRPKTVIKVRFKPRRVEEILTCLIVIGGQIQIRQHKNIFLDGIGCKPTVVLENLTAILNNEQDRKWDSVEVVIESK